MRAVMMVPGSTGAAMELREVPEPTPGPREVIVAVRAAALNRGEIARRRTLTRGEPVISGIECAGEVVALGDEVTTVATGVRVMAQAARCYAERVAIDERLLMPVPDAFSWEEAGAFPNTFVTAHDAIVTNGGLARGESVLVNAASSGIGVIAIQIAKHCGASPVIATTTSPTKIPALEQVGADIVIDVASVSAQEDIRHATSGRGVDLVVDSVGAAAFSANMGALSIGGRLIGVGRLGGRHAEIDLDLLALKRLKLIGVTFRTRSTEEKLACTSACLRDLGRPLAEGVFRPIIDRVLPLEEIDAAHRYMEQDAHLGKIVLSVSNDPSAEGDAG